MRAALSLAIAASLLAAPVMAADSSDPGAQRIEHFEQALLATMKAGKALGAEGRYRKLEPAIEQAFNLPLMTRFVIGPKWSNLSAADQALVMKAFKREIVATYAHNFDSFGGESFTTLGVENRGPDKLVRTSIASPGQAATPISYRMQQSGGAWKVIDVYFNGAISQLTTQRSDFASALAGGGAAAVAKKMDDLADRQLKAS